VLFRSAVAGRQGDLRTFRVCCRIVRGFDLSDDEAVRALSEWNARCDPPWSERELRQKVRSEERRVGKEGRSGGGPRRESWRWGPDRRRPRRHSRRVALDRRQAAKRSGGTGASALGSKGEASVRVGPGDTQGKYAPASSPLRAACSQSSGKSKR